jgi:hypothetical protein
MTPVLQIRRAACGCRWHHAWHADSRGIAAGVVCADDACTEHAHLSVAANSLRLAALPATLRDAAA